MNHHAIHNTTYSRGRLTVAIRHRSHRTAFTLMEILIVVAILGILAAVTLPTIQGHIIDAKEAAAKDNLRTLRQAIERYANDHDDIAPGYPENDPRSAPSPLVFNIQLISTKKYLSELPENPFNGIATLKMVDNNTDFQDEPEVTTLFGWIYKPATKTIKLNWPGKDSKGVPYYNY